MRIKGTNHHLTKDSFSCYNYLKAGNEVILIFIIKCGQSIFKFDFLRRFGTQSEIEIINNVSHDD